MCAEKDPISCHRAILICKHLRFDALTIQHIINKETIETQEELEHRLVNTLKIYPDFFENKDPIAVIERAYAVQGTRISYSLEPTENREDQNG
jgi:hypothetical protein